jgi:hypothetical protein
VGGRRERKSFRKTEIVSHSANKKSKIGKLNKKNKNTKLASSGSHKRKH